MLNYFSNYRFQDNNHKAICKQTEDKIRKEIYRYEMNPLKNLNAANGILDKIEEEQKNLEAPHSFNLGIYNPYALCIVFTFFHLRGIRLAKKNLNEMDFPVTFMANNFLYAVVGSVLFGTFFTRNFRNYRESLKAKKNTYYLISRFRERYCDSRKKY